MKFTSFLKILALALALSGYSAWSMMVRERNPDTRARAEIPATSIPLLRLPDAETLWKQSSTVFLDVRSPFDYACGHIAGAINLPEEEFDQCLPTMMPQLQRARAIVVYCKSIDCGKSLWSALRLHQAGLTQVTIYPEGWNEWSLHRLPTAAAQ